jgi:hemerythrin-like domain-containing protein
MQPLTIKLIIAEHRAMGTVLGMLRHAVKSAGTSGQAFDFNEVRAMLFYLDEMPAKVHHVTESELLFPRIRKRCHPLRPVLDRLQSEHDRGELAVRNLENSLVTWQVMGDTHREVFELMLNGYIDNYLGHMDVEERYVLPVAMEYLTKSDWQELNDAFKIQLGSLGGSMTQGHRELFQKIVSNHSLS